MKKIEAEGKRLALIHTALQAMDKEELLLKKVKADRSQNEQYVRYDNEHNPYVSVDDVFKEMDQYPEQGALILQTKAPESLDGFLNLSQETDELSQKLGFATGKDMVNDNAPQQSFLTSRHLHEYFFYRLLNSHAYKFLDKMEKNSAEMEPLYRTIKLGRVQFLGNGSEQDKMWQVIFNSRAGEVSGGELFAGILINFVLTLVGMGLNLGRWWGEAHTHPEHAFNVDGTLREKKLWGWNPEYQNTPFSKLFDIFALNPEIPDKALQHYAKRVGPNAYWFWGKDYYFGMTPFKGEKEKLNRYLSLLREDIALAEALVRFGEAYGTFHPEMYEKNIREHLGFQNPEEAQDWERINRAHKSISRRDYSIYRTLGKHMATVNSWDLKQFEGRWKPFLLDDDYLVKQYIEHGLKTGRLKSMHHHYPRNKPIIG